MWRVLTVLDYGVLEAQLTGLRILIESVESAVNDEIHRIESEL